MGIIICLTLSFIVIVIYIKMNELLHQRFFRLLSEYSQRKVPASEFAEAIEELATHLADFSINEQDYSVLLRYFPLVCIDSNRIVCNLSRGKNALLLLIDESDRTNQKQKYGIVNLRIKYPEQFQQHANKLFLSPLHLTNKTSLINVMEIVSGLYLSKRVTYQNGKPIHLTDLGKAFEWVFNIKLGELSPKYMECHQAKACQVKRVP